TEGLVEEVQSFYNAGLREDLTSMKAIGYKEFFPYFRGEMSLEACVDKLKQNTRNFAKRQLTWFRHQANPLFIPVDQLNFDATSIVDKMLQQLQNIVD
ncbi:MAG: tRNA dimethylallyltransferase, partial [Niameybacter sp.]